MTTTNSALTEKIIGCAYRVANVLGHGFLEKVYENALSHELTQAGLRTQAQYPLQVLYDHVVVGEYLADLCVEDNVLIEIKAVKKLQDIHVAQCINYLKASGYPICLLLNFGSPRVEVRRLMHPG